MHIVCDIGGTKTRIAGSRDLEHFDEPIILDTPEKYEEGISLIEESIKHLVAGDTVEGIAMGVTGVLVEGKKSVVHSNVEDWNGRAIADDLASAFGARVYLENDTALVGLGEAVFGAGAGTSLVMYMTVSTGVNAVRIVDGRIDRAAFGFETGDQYLFLGDTPMHLGELISGKAISLKYGMHPRELGKDWPEWDRLARIAAFGIYNSIVHWSPERIVLGGSMFNEIGISVDRIRDVLKEINVKYPTLPNVVHSSLGEVGGLWGGLALLKQMA